MKIFVQKIIHLNTKIRLSKKKMEKIDPSIRPIPTSQLRLDAEAWTSARARNATRRGLSDARKPRVECSSRG